MPAHAQPKRVPSSSSSSSSVGDLSHALSTQLDLGVQPASPAAAPTAHFSRRSAPRLYLLLSLLQYRCVQERLRGSVVDVDATEDSVSTQSGGDRGAPLASAPASAPAARLYECYRFGTRLRFRCMRDVGHQR